MKRSKAVLVDRDGILNEMIYYPDPGVVDSPFTPRQFELVDGIGPALRAMKAAGYKLVLVSNQPSVAKKHLTMATFKKIQEKMHRLLAAEGVRLDGEYYCFHHPQAKIAKFRVVCECRKPKPGMLLQAAKDLDLDLANSFMIGDGLYDVGAGKAAGCKTILVANLNALLSRKMDETGTHPDFVARNVSEAADMVKKAGREVPMR
ncbi:MAG: HAD family hydrolase [Nitrososphaerota archaeon]|nr:HAD family hydrolase [Nitrososphaerota archaeon]MDG7023118.1 HAD family hydrolase [Nitrososphaerota archaeon]